MNGQQLLPGEFQGHRKLGGRRQEFRRLARGRQELCAQKGRILVSILQTGDESQHQAFFPAQVLAALAEKAQRAVGASAKVSDQAFKPPHRRGSGLFSQMHDIIGLHLAKARDIPFAGEMKPSAVTTDNQALRLPRENAGCGAFLILIVLDVGHGHRSLKVQPVTKQIAKFSQTL
ncbi:MAG: hypothetical protein RIC18_14160 [Hoeflea sp.]|uniref:hypothetical protein n=1 Tax=Hoeflea sp. TaxID=1940281 RepID=UPI0032F03D03